MLAVSPLRNGNNERENSMEGFSMEENIDFADFSGGNLLDSIDFDDLFVGISDGDVLPDLEMDPEILAEFSVSGGGSGDESELNNIPSSDVSVDQKFKAEDNNNNNNHSNNGSSSSSTKLQEKVLASASAASVSLSSSSGDQEIVSKRDNKPAAGVINNNHSNNLLSPKESDKGRKSLSHSKNPSGKRKVKVDWTPELHRRFVQAVEQLGVDKAVPSRILELMGIDCLTRHNIASHLQKYRSHRKHLLAREAEAASWSQRRQMYGCGGGGAATAGKREHPWISAAPPTIGFPPAASHVAPMPHHHHFRPLHVWGHPSVDQSMMHMWPKHLTPSPPPPHTWPPPPPPPHDPSFWVPHPQHVPTPGTPCFPPAHLPPTRFATPPVPGIPPPPSPMYKVEPAGHGGVPPVAPGQALPQPPCDIHPSKESVDAAIGDVLTKPWLPLPLGLKPPLIDSVMVELQRQGISKIPPTCASTSIKI